MDELSARLHRERFRLLVELQDKLDPQTVPAGAAFELFSLLAGTATLLTHANHFAEGGGGADEQLGSLADLMAMMAAGELTRRVISGWKRGETGDANATGRGIAEILKRDDLFRSMEGIEGLARAEKTAAEARHRERELNLIIGRFRDAVPLNDAVVDELVREWVFERFCSVFLWLLKELRSTLRNDAHGSSMDYLKFFLLLMFRKPALRDFLQSPLGGEESAALATRILTGLEATAEE